MNFSQETLDRFLQAYEQNTNNSDTSAAAAQFADTFVAAGPDGPVMVPAALFARSLPARKQQLEKAGLRQSKLIARSDTPISERYVLVRTQWQIDFIPQDRPARAITVSSSFLIDMGGSEPKILVYLAGQDIFKLLQEDSPGRSESVPQE
jgi:hypothetical protein